MLDRVVGRTGYASALLVVPLVVANTIEVFMRYVFNRPSDWAIQATVMC